MYVKKVENVSLMFQDVINVNHADFQNVLKPICVEKVRKYRKILISYKYFQLEKNKEIFDFFSYQKQTIKICLV
jgi:hypothetical protein